MKFRIIALLLTILISLSLILTACRSEEETDPNDTSAAESNQNSENETTEEEQTLKADVPIVDYDGYTFRILTFAVAGNESWDFPDLTAESETGETLNDAVYMRNTVIEERYNIKIKEIHSTNFATDLRNSVAAQTDDYDLVSNALTLSLSPVSQGFFYDFNELEYIDLTKPWYHQQSIKELSINHKLPLLLSDLLLSDEEATSIIIFNKNLVKDMGLQDPYSMVKDGSWTVDNMYEMLKDVPEDLNGDGKMTVDDDLFGFMSMPNTMECMLHSGGGRIAGKDENDLPMMMFDREITYDAMNIAFQLLYDDNMTINIQKNMEGVPQPAITRTRSIFGGDRAVFAWVRMYNLRFLRDMESDFGLLPIPKIYADQKNYVNTINPNLACAISVPITATDIERTSILLEALAAESHFRVVNSYYEEMLKIKLTRDDESAEIIDFIFDNRFLDVGTVYDFGGFYSGFYSLSFTNNTNLKSFYEARIRTCEEAIKNLIEAMQ